MIQKEFMIYDHRYEVHMDQENNTITVIRDGQNFGATALFDEEDVCFFPCVSNTIYTKPINDVDEFFEDVKDYFKHIEMEVYDVIFTCSPPLTTLAEKIFTDHSNHLQVYQYRNELFMIKNQKDMTKIDIIRIDNVYKYHTDTFARDINASIGVLYDNNTLFLSLKKNICLFTTNTTSSGSFGHLSMKKSEFDSHIIHLLRNNRLGSFDINGSMINFILTHHDEAVKFELDNAQFLNPNGPAVFIRMKNNIKSYNLLKYNGQNFDITIWKRYLIEFFQQHENDNITLHVHYGYVILQSHNHFCIIAECHLA